MITVEDSGKGIPPHLLKRIFEPFFTTKPDGKGTGLGLSVVSTILHNAKGSISVENGGSLGGAKFIVELPAAKDDSL